jgi:DNA-binding transcriptional regulator YiaG
MTTVQKVEKKKPATTKTVSKDPAELVREVRAGLGLSQTGLGRMLGVHDQTIHRWEKGRFPPTPLQKALLSVCRSVLASDQASVVRGQVMAALKEEDALGPARAVYAVLHAEFGVAH